MHGVLPTMLRPIASVDQKIINRFYKTCLGWVRYKPLLLFITQNDRYDELIDDMKQKLSATLPKISAYFGKPEFMDLLPELERYHKNVRRHYVSFLKVQKAWAGIMSFLAETGKAEEQGEAIV
jgi:hypothetical protein